MSYNNPRKPHLLFVDDEADILKSLRRFIRRYDWHCEFAESGEAALALLQEQEFDVVISDMRMPQMSGATLLQRVREHDPDTVRILLTGFSDTDSLLEAVNEAKIYNYITKPWDDELLAELLEGAVRYRDILRHNQELQHITKQQNNLLNELNESLEQKVNQRTRQLSNALKTIELHNSQLEDNFSNIAAILASLIEHKEGKRNNHSRSVADLCVTIANHMQLNNQETESLRIAAMLHDIGMLGLSDAVHKMPLNHLSKAELREYRTHPVIAETTLAGIGNMGDIGQIVRMHHEKIDGSGFPDGLVGNQISFSAKILCVVSDYHDLLNGQLDDSINGFNASIYYLQNKYSQQYDQGIVNTLVDVLAKDDKQKSGSITIDCSELTPEMRLASDLIAGTGLLLLCKGTVLSDKTIERLVHYELEANTKLKVVIQVDQKITLQDLPMETQSTTE